MVFNFFNSKQKYKNQLIHNRYISCSCYKTQICYTLTDSNKVFACHCSRCINDNNIYSCRDNAQKPIIWVPIKNYDIHNEFTNNLKTTIKWSKSSFFAKRGYCPYCNEILFIKYPFTKYIQDINLSPTIDIFCNSRNKLITNKCLNSWPKIFLYKYF